MAGDIKLHLMPMGGGVKTTISLVDLWGALLNADIVNVRVPNVVKSEGNITALIDLLNDQINDVINGSGTLASIKVVETNLKGILPYIGYDPTLKYDKIPSMSFTLGTSTGTPFAKSFDLSFHQCTVVIDDSKTLSSGNSVKRDFYGCTLKFGGSGIIISEVLDDCTLSNLGTGKSVVTLCTRTLNRVTLEGKRFDFEMNNTKPYILNKCMIKADLFTSDKNDTVKCIMDECALDNVNITDIECALYSCTGNVTFESGNGIPIVIVQGTSVPSITIAKTYNSSIVNLTGKMIDVRLKLEKGDNVGMSISINGAVKLRPPTNTDDSSIIKVSNGDSSAINDQFIYSNNPIDEKIPDFQRSDLPRGSVTTDDPYSFGYSGLPIDVNGGTLDHRIIANLLRLFRSKKFAKAMHPTLAKRYVTYCELRGIKLEPNASMNGFFDIFGKFCKLFKRK